MWLDFENSSGSTGYTVVVQWRIYERCVPLWFPRFSNFSDSKMLSLTQNLEHTMLFAFGCPKIH